MKKRVLLLLTVCLQALFSLADETPNEKQARRIFDDAYQKVFGDQGATLSYDVNIVGIYKTHGTIWYKGKKQKFVDERVNTWNDGVTAYMAFRKKHTVEIHHANSDKKDKYSGKFKFSVDDFRYNVENDESTGLMVLTMKQKKGAKSTIKEVRAWVSPGTHEPVKLRIKVAFIWTTIKISNFRSGGIDDALFTFPKSQYKDWKFVDKRKE